MRIQLRSLLLPLGFLILLFGAWTQAGIQEDEVTLEVQSVAGPVHMLTGMGGNLGVSVGPDGVLLIDDQFAQLAPKILASLDSLAQAAGLDSGAPRFLINTHHHADHTGANVEMGRTATIFAHENVRARLLDPPQGEPMAAAGLPLVTYEDGLSLHFNGERVRLVHFNHGHTDGDTVVYFSGSNVMHTGDLCFNRMFPFIDLDAGGSVTGYIQNLEVILSMTDENTRYIPGHGVLATRTDLLELQSTLADVLVLVSMALKEGKSAEEMKQEKLLARFDDWSWSFIPAERMIDTVVRELSEG